MMPSRPRFVPRPENVGPRYLSLLHPSPAKRSPQNFRPLNRPGSGRICASGLGFFNQNDTENLAPDARLSPKLGGWPIYSASFVMSNFNANRFTMTKKLVSRPLSKPHLKPSLRSQIMGLRLPALGAPRMTFRHADKDLGLPLFVPNPGISSNNVAPRVGVEQIVSIRLRWIAGLHQPRC